MDITKKGVWPVMLTPFTENGEVDYTALKALIEWYEERGVSGLFAVCQSSEMFFLSLRERTEIAAFVKKNAHVPVIASGHISYAPEDQLDELNRMADTGVDAVILITNRMVQQGDNSLRWKERFIRLTEALPARVPLGLYECPYPYKWVLSDEEIRFCAESGRFRFLKDTCCSAERIRRRLEILNGSPLKLYNANTTTLLETLRDGAEGFSGVMANFHPELYVWLCENYEKEPEKAETLQGLLTSCSWIEKQLYPVNAKAYLQAEGLPVTRVTRSRNELEYTPTFAAEVEQIRRNTAFIKESLHIR